MAPCGGRCRRCALHYAVKCNPEPALLARLHALGAGFEVASLAELRMLAALGVDAGSVLYSNPVKPPAHIAGACALGLDRFAVDSRCELEKLAADAPGARVYVRLDASDPTSRVPLAGKFGVDPATAIELLLEARAVGLVPYGLTFHVGSQALDPVGLRAGDRAVGRRHARRSQPWPAARAARYRRRPARALHRGDPADRGVRRGDLRGALARLPYPVEVVAEPGRALVAEAGVLATTVIGVADRAGRRWVHLDVGAFNGMMETLETRRELIFPLAWSSRGPRRLVPCAVTGPTCDSEDTMFFDVPLPDDLRAGDRLYIGTAGAYTTAYASRFNGFDVPRTHLVGAAPQAAPEQPRLALA